MFRGGGVGSCRAQTKTQRLEIGGQSAADTHLCCRPGSSRPNMKVVRCVDRQARCLLARCANASRPSRPGMTDRNRARLRPFRDPANVERLVGMPAAALHSLQTSDPEIGYNQARKLQSVIRALEGGAWSDALNICFGQTRAREGYREADAGADPRFRSRRTRTRQTFTVKRSPTPRGHP
jgi:hypothetical protein